MPAGFVERADERALERHRTRTGRTRDRASSERVRLSQQRKDERAALKARAAATENTSRGLRGAVGIGKIVGSGGISANAARRLGGQVCRRFSAVLRCLYS